MTAMVYIKYANAEIMITGIEAESLGGAEHRILDKFHDVDNALADDQSKLTQYTIELMANAKIMSLNEFEIRYNARKARYQKAVNERLEWRQEQEEEIRKLEERIAGIKKNIEYTEEEIKELMDEGGVKRQYTAEEKIDEAINRYNTIA